MRGRRDAKIWHKKVGSITAFPILTDFRRLNETSPQTYCRKGFYKTSRSQIARQIVKLSTSSHEFAKNFEYSTSLSQGEEKNENEKRPQVKLVYISKAICQIQHKMNNKVNKRHRRAVEKAIIEQNTDFLDKAFRKKDGMLKRGDKNGYTLLHFAAENSTERMVKYLLNKGFPLKRTRFSQTALHLAVIGCNYRVVKLLLNYGCPINEIDDSSRTALHYAVSNYCQRKSSARNRMIHLLLRRGASVNASTHHGETPFLQAIEYRSEYLTRLFLRHAILVNRRSKNGETALHFAVQRSCRDIVEILLDAGASVNSITKEGKTALHLAVASARCEEIVDLLIERGAMINAKDHDGKTPIFMASRVFVEEIHTPVKVKRRHDIIHSLLEAGAEVNHRSNAGEPAFHEALKTGLASIIQLFLERGADVMCRNASGWSTLHVAVKYAPEKIVDTLIDKGAPIDAKTSYGALTPLHVAVQYRKEMHIKSLLARGADINVLDYTGHTPLHYAVLYFYPDVNIFLDNGADPLVRSKSDESPLDYAVNTSRVVPTIKCLLRHLALMEAMGSSTASEVISRGVNNVDVCLQIYEKYRHEIVIMKEQKIDEKVSYFEILSRDPKWIASFVRKDGFADAFKDDEVVRKFPLYGEMAKRRFNDAVHRKDLTEIAIENLLVAFSDIELPILIVEKLVKYYELEELEKFVKSCRETGRADFSGEHDCPRPSVQGRTFSWPLREEKALLHDT